MGDVGDEPVVPLGPGESRDLGEVAPIGLTRDAAATTRVRVGRGRRAGLLVVLAVLVIGGLGAAALLASGGDTDPDEALAAAQASAAEATSFRFTLSSESAMSIGDAENGTDTTTRSTGEGAWAGSRWHVRSGGELESETIVDGGTTYVRYAGFESEGEVAGDLDDELWEKYDEELLSREDMLDELELMSEEEDDESGFTEDVGYRDMIDIALAQSVYLGTVDGPVGSIATAGLGMGSTIDTGFATDPRGFLAAIDRMAEPQLVDEAAGVTTLATTLAAPGDVAEALGRPLPEAKVELDVGADGLPVALRLDVASGASWSNLEITFSDWNQPVEITIPPDDQVDANPMVDEESLLALRDLTLVWPTELPEGWELTIFSPEETAEMDVNDGDCDAVELDWDDWSDESEEGTYLWLLERPLDCALAADATPFQPGGPGGLPSRPGTIFGTVEVQVGETAVAIDATLEGAELDAVLATLAPVDAQTLIDAVPATFG